jgi:hypothetical protein
MHHGDMDPKFIGTYVEELKSSPARFASTNRHAVLIVRDIGASSNEEDAAFQTKFMSRGDLLAAGSGERSLDAEPSVAVGHVLFIQKREGGVFPDRIGIGRAPNADVRIPLSQVSKYHAYFSKEAESWSITDAGSRNGTSVQGVRLTDRTPHPIADGHEIGIGPYRFAFHTADGFHDLVKRRAGLR